MGNSEEGFSPKFLRVISREGAFWNGFVNQSVKTEFGRWETCKILPKFCKDKGRLVKIKVFIFDEELLFFELLLFQDAIQLQQNENRYQHRVVNRNIFSKWSLFQFHLEVVEL